MAALPYMQLYIADYLADTVHLEADEHGAYLLLMMNYWQTGKPIPKNRLQAIAKITCNERWTTVEQTLNEFFNDTGTHWQHSRIDADLKMVEESQKQRSKAGRASAEARKRAKQKQNKERNQELNIGRSTTVERPINEPSNDRSTNKETEADIDTEKKKTTKKESAGVEPPSPLAPGRLMSHLLKSGYTQIQLPEFEPNIVSKWQTQGVTIHELDKALATARESKKTKTPDLSFIGGILKNQQQAKPPSRKSPKPYQQVQSTCPIGNQAAYEARHAEKLKAQVEQQRAKKQTAMEEAS